MENSSALSGKNFMFFFGIVEAIRQGELPYRPKSQVQDKTEDEKG